MITAKGIIPLGDPVRLVEGVEITRMLAMIQDYLLQGPPAANGWVVKPVDTGTDTQTAGRIRRLQPWLEDGTFFLTWADGVADIDLEAAEQTVGEIVKNGGKCPCPQKAER